MEGQRGRVGYTCVAMGLKENWNPSDSGVVEPARSAGHANHCRIRLEDLLNRDTAGKAVFQIAEERVQC